MEQTTPEQDAKELYDFYTTIVDTSKKLKPEQEVKSISFYVEQHVEEEIKNLEKAFSVAERITPGSGIEYFQPSIDRLHKIIEEVKKLDETKK